VGVQLVSPRRSTLSRMPEVFPPLAAGVAAAIAVITLVGWQFRIASLREPIGGFMAPNAALCVLMLSAAIVLYRWRDRTWARTIATVLEVCVALFCAVILFEHLTDINTGLTQIFFHHRLSDWNLPSPVPGRFAPNAAIAFILLSAALSIGHGNGRRELSQNITGFAIVMGLLAIIGHAYGVKFLYNLQIQNYMALTTALSIVCLGLATLMSVVPDGWVAIILRNDAAGMLSRRVLFITYMAIPLLGYIAVSYERNHWITSTFGVSLVVVAGLLILTSTVIRSAREIRKLERERTLTEERLREAEKLAVTGRLAATLAHEVNNPLEAVMNILFLLGNDDSLNENSREFLKLAEEELLRVTHITRQTLAFYREPASPIPVHLDDQVRQVIRVFQPKLNAKRIGVEFSSTADAEYVIHAGEFKQIVTNLLANAIDAVAREGRIVIRVRPTRIWNSTGDVGFRVTIADNGTGISRTDRKRLFEPFFTTKGQRGTGLGLWVTQGLVTKHGGNLRMHSCTRTQRRGTTFSIFFPSIWQVTSSTEDNSKAAAYRSAG
jgi:signal transduction histidine kinase